MNIPLHYRIMAGFVCSLVDLLKLLQDTETKPDDCRFESKILIGGGLCSQNIQTKSFLPFLKRELSTAKRVDVVPR